MSPALSGPQLLGESPKTSVPPSELGFSSPIPEPCLLFRTPTQLTSMDNAAINTGSMAL